MVISTIASDADDGTIVGLAGPPDTKLATLAISTDFPEPVSPVTATRLGSSPRPMHIASLLPSLLTMPAKFFDLIEET